MRPPVRYHNQRYVLYSGQGDPSLTEVHWAEEIKVMKIILLSYGKVVMKSKFPESSLSLSYFSQKKKRQFF